MAHSIVFVGKSGERHHFQVWPIATRFRPLGAVYIATRRACEDPTFAAKASHYPLAIGVTADLSGGPFTPAQLKALVAKGANYICVCAAADAERRKHIEQDVIEGNERAGGQLQHLVNTTPDPQCGAAPVTD